MTKLIMSGEYSGIHDFDFGLDIILDRLVRAKIRARFGGRIQAMVSGGAPLNPDVGVFFTALGLPLLQAVLAKLLLSSSQV